MRDCVEHSFFAGVWGVLSVLLERKKYIIHIKSIILLDYFQ